MRRRQDWSRWNERDWLTIPARLTRVIFGLRTSKEDQDVVRKALESQSTVQFGQVEGDSTDYRLRVVPR